MHKFVRNLITEWRRLELPFRDETVIVGVSGGADSVSLLLAFHDLIVRKKLGHRLIAAHLNHQLRGPESDEDEKFVHDLTRRLNIELISKRGDVNPKGNLEENARNARYEFLNEAAVRLKAFAVLTGHTINDQAETFLMNLIRGSGREGLSGMPSVRSFESVPTSSKSVSKNAKPETPLLKLKLVRPLLKWARRIDTEAFCHDLGIEYRYDTMNEDTAFKRVRIRKILIPLLEDFNPKIIETLASTASRMQALTEPRGSGNRFPVPGELILSEVKKLSQSQLYETIRAWLRQHRGTTRRLQLKHIEAVERLIFSSKSGKTAELPGGRIIKTGGKLVYDENKVEN